MNRCTIGLLAIVLPATASARTIHTVGPSQDHATIAEAISASVAGDVIQVSAGTYSECLFVDRDLRIHGVDGPGSTTLECDDPAGYAVLATAQLNLSGFTVTHVAGGAGIGSSASSLVVSDAVFDGLTGVDGGAIEFVGGTLYVYDTEISNSVAELGGGIYVANGDLHIWDSQFSDTDADQGGAIYVLNANVEAVDVDIVRGTADTGGALYVLSDDITFGYGAEFVRGSITGATAGGDGGAVTAESVILTVIGATFDGNDAGGNGGAIWADQSLWVQDSTFTGNTASSGGAIGVQDAEATLRGNTFTSNGADPLSGGFGGAVDGFFANLFTADNTFTGNSARLGGGVYAGATWISAGDLFDGNSATDNGGGGNAAAQVEITQSEFVGNGAGSRGGGLYTRFDISGVSQSMSSCLVSGNTADLGGGVYHGSDEYLVVQGCVIENNTAASDGGGVYVEARAALLLASRVSGNDASRGGGLFFDGPFADPDTGFEVQNSTIADNTADVGGGVWLSRGRLAVSNATLRGNEATGASGSGGGAFLDRPIVVNLTGAIFCDNSAALHGGGVYMRAPEDPASPTGGGSVFITGTVFQENSAVNFGGAFYEDGAVAGAARTTFDNATVIGNMGNGRQGGLSAQIAPIAGLNPSRFTITDSVLQGNGQSGAATIGSNTVSNPIQVSRSDFGGHTQSDVTAQGTWDLSANFSDQAVLTGGSLLDDTPIPAADFTLDGDCGNDTLFDQYNAGRGGAAWPGLYFDQDGDGVTIAGGDCAPDFTTDPDADLRAPVFTEVPGNDIDEDCEQGPDFDGDTDGYVAETSDGSDCADTDGNIHPGATDLPDNIDQDCSGADNDDGDGDTWRWVGVSADCDDTDSNVHPVGMETFYDGTDADCDGFSDNDADLDGYDSDQQGGNDCDDFSDQWRPGATDAWYDGEDRNCDGANDYDRDGDGYVSQAYPGTEGGTAPFGGDCNDLVASINPGAAEFWYDGNDDNCDGANDYDADGDGYVAEGYEAQAGGTAPFTGDCNDNNGNTYPGAAEVCDGVVNDCSGGSEELDDDGDHVLDYWEAVYGMNTGSTDSDNDGIPDGVEWALADASCLDNANGPQNTDGTDQIDALDNDSDNDHVPDQAEGDDDADDDGLPNFRDEDDDDDTISTSVETDGLGAPIDADDDGTPDYLDIDADNDGALDISEGTADGDEDGIGDWRDNGSDADAARAASPMGQSQYGFGCQSAPVAPSLLMLGLAVLGLRRRGEQDSP